MRSQKALPYFISGFLILSGTQAIAQAPVPFLKENGKFIYVDPQTKKPQFNGTYEFAHPFHAGLAPVSQDGRVYILNVAGQPTADSSFQEVDRTLSGNLIGRTKEGYVFITDQGRKQPYRFQIVPEGYREDRMVTRDPATGKMGLTDTWTSRIILYNNFDFIRPYAEGAAAVLQDGQWRFVDGEGNQLSTDRYEDLGSFSENVAAARKNGQWGYINKDSKWVIDPAFEDARPFTNGNAFVRKGGKWMQIDMDGKEVNTFSYQQVTEPFDGVFAFMENGRWGYANAHSGKVVIPAKYLRVAPFVDGLALVSTEGSRFYITKDGTELREK